MFRFIHTSDLHLGKRFGQLPEDLRGRLTEARHLIIERLSQLAQAEQADAILVAGDIFDTGTPSPSVIRQALQAMGENRGVKWVLIPGNHDSLAEDELWAQIKNNKPENVILALDQSAIEVQPSVYILPAPCTIRRPGRDLTQWMNDCETPPDAIRIGLAHGAIQDFGEDGATDIISPNRATEANLDYLALGDWHGEIEISKRLWYSGTPEPDRFKDNQQGCALVVSIDGKGATPVVKSEKVGSFDWQILRLSLLPGMDIEQELNDKLPDLSQRRDTLLQVHLEGRLKLFEQINLDALLIDLEPDFAWLEVRKDNLALDYDVTDLDAIDQAGALRRAADKLYDKAQQDDDPNSVAATALSLLASFSMEDQ